MVRVVVVEVVVTVGRVCSEMVLVDVTVESIVTTGGVIVVFSVLVLAVTIELTVVVLLMVV